MRCPRLGNRSVTHTGRPGPSTKGLLGSARPLRVRWLASQDPLPGCAITQHNTTRRTFSKVTCGAHRLSSTRVKLVPVGDPSSSQDAWHEGISLERGAALRPEDVDGQGACGGHCAPESQLLESTPELPAPPAHRGPPDAQRGSRHRLLGAGVGRTEPPQQAQNYRP